MKRVLALLASMLIVILLGCNLLPTKTDTDKTDPLKTDDVVIGVHGTISVDTIWSATNKNNVIDGNLEINSNVTWEKNINVIINDNASVKINNSGTLTIKEGVKIVCGTGSYFEIGYSSSAGTLIAKGTDSLPIVFTKNSGVQNWGYNTNVGGGILLYSGATNLTTLEHCVIEYATQGIYVYNNKPVIKNCKIVHNATVGILFDGTGAPKDSASFVGNQINGNGTYPISIEAEGITNLEGNTIITDNGKQAIEVMAGNVTQSGTWKNNGVPYIFTGPVKIGKSTTGVSITLMSGTVCKFDPDAYLEIGYTNPATFIASGTDSNRIVFAPSTLGSTWGYNGGNVEGGIWIGEKATSNTSLKYCTIQKATAGIYVTKSKVTITNCIIKDCLKSGINFANAGSPIDSLAFVNDTITGNAEYAIEIDASQLGALSGIGSIAGNTLGGIYVNSDDITSLTHIWKKHDAPYFISGKVTIKGVSGATVTIRPGAQFLMATDAYLEIGYTNPGTLIANGTATDSIKFVGIVSGLNWGYAGGNIEGGIWIAEKAANTSFTYCSVSGANTGFYIKQANVTIKKCTIQNCSINAVTLDNNAPQTNITDNTFANNTGGNVVVAP